MQLSVKEGGSKSFVRQMALCDMRSLDFCPAGEPGRSWKQGEVGSDAHVEKAVQRKG